MAYVPPHKRYSGAADNPTPFPASLSRRFNQSLNLDRPPAHRRTNIKYSAEALSLWWIAGGSIDPARFRLVPFSLEPVLQYEKEFLVLTVAGDQSTVAHADEPPLPPPWEVISQRLERHLLSAVTSARSELAVEGEEIKMSFVARIGKVLFHRKNSLKSLMKSAAAEEDISRNVKKLFYTNLSIDHFEELRHLDVHHLGFNFEAEKERYLVSVFDESRNSFILCKCAVVEGGSLQVYEIELSKVRHLVVDISCLSKDDDLRLMLANKIILKTWKDGEEDHINQLISNAVLDPDVKGGLRWPPGKDTAGPFTIFGSSHLKYKTFRSESIELEYRYADRFDHNSSSGEVSNEVKFKLIGISNLLREEHLETSSLSIMVQDAVKLIWENFFANVGGTSV